MLRQALVLWCLRAAAAVVVDITDAGDAAPLRQLAARPRVRQLLDANDKLRSLGLDASFDFPRRAGARILRRL